jgi:hypothetical protein
MARFCGAGTAQPPYMPIKYMFIVQRYVYRATVRPDAGRCQAEFCTANVVSDRHRRVWGAAIILAPAQKPHAGTGRLGADNPTIVAQFCVQARKIAIRIRMTASTATAVFVSVTNVRYICS